MTGNTTPPLDHEHDGQEDRREAGDAEHDAAEQGERVDIVAIGVRLPQIELGQFVIDQFGDEGDGGAGVERDLEDVGLRIGDAFGTDAGIDGQNRDAIRAEIGIDDAGARQAVEGRNQQALDLHIAFVAERKQGPARIGAFLLRQHLDAANDAVGTGSGRQLHAAALARHDVDAGPEIDGTDRVGNVDDLEGPCPRDAERADHESKNKAQHETHYRQVFPNDLILPRNPW